VLWLLDDPAPLLARRAPWGPPQPPLPVSLDARLGSLEVRGLARHGAARVERGPSSGAARQVLHVPSAGRTARAALSEKAPLFGVEPVESGGERWGAVAGGAGARFAEPLEVPRIPSLPEP
jgi:hypothetical protein